MENLKNLLYRLADGQMILGHRNSEWTGLGPILEEDIAFASLAQDKIGHALALYTILNENLGEAEPDTIAFSRKPAEWKNPILCEIYTKDYAFALVRHFMMDHLSAIRFGALANSEYEPVAKVAKKFNAEIKYHLMHADIWMKNLANGTEESKAKIQTAVNQCFEYGEGLFETETEVESTLYIGETEVKNQWLATMQEKLTEFGLTTPALGNKGDGSTKGNHTDDLTSMLNEMTEVYDIEPTAQW